MPIPRKGGFRYLNDTRRETFYTHLLFGWTGVVNVYQELHMLQRIEDNWFYQWYHPTQWKADIKLYKSLMSESNAKQINQALWGSLIDLMIDLKTIELIPDILFLRIVKCPMRSDLLISENSIHITYKSQSQFKGRSVIGKYYKDRNQGHKYKLNVNFLNAIENTKKTYPPMLGYNGNVHKQLKNLK